MFNKVKVVHQKFGTKSTLDKLIDVKLNKIFLAWENMGAQIYEPFSWANLIGNYISF